MLVAGEPKKDDLDDGNEVDEGFDEDANNASDEDNDTDDDEVVINLDDLILKQFSLKALTSQDKMFYVLSFVFCANNFLVYVCVCVLQYFFKVKNGKVFIIVFHCFLVI